MGLGRKKIILISAVSVVVIAAIVIPIAIVYSRTDETTPTPDEGTSTPAPVEDLGNRIACFPLDAGLNSETCTNKGCLWDADGVQVKCYLPTGSQSYGYQISQAPVSSSDGFTVDLKRSDSPSLYGGDHDQVVFKVIYYTDDTFRFMFYPAGADVEKHRPPVPLNLPPAATPSNSLYDVTLKNQTVGAPFDLQIVRKSTQTVLFDTSLGGLTIAEQFLMITTSLASKYLYGIGENSHDSFAHDMNYKMWPIFARDQPPGDGELNLYGSHPFYTVSEDDGSSHGVFFFNSHSIDVTTLPAPGLTYRTIGGLLEFFVFMGPRPEEVVEQYTRLIGRTVMPAYWSLGFQICRYGYNDTAEIVDVVDRNRAKGIPQDVQYADIDYMDNQADFTIGQRFANLPDYVAAVKANGTRFILILDPAINSEKDNYPSYDRGFDSDVYIKWYNDTLQPPSDCAASPSNCQNVTDVMLGYVWPDGRTAFPDWFKPSTQDWWQEEIVRLHGQIQFDGIWIDMNEPANFDTNKNKPFNWPASRPDWNLVCPPNKWDDPPYITLAASRSDTKRLSDKTICMVGKQGRDDEFLHYDVHNLYGWSQTEPTNRAARNATKQRSIVISRSTFPSSGKWAGHWLGDNTARWKDMHTSIIGMMEFNMFGIAYIGADICGFFGESTEKLCQRWMELGAFYPFSRNHNTINMPPQDPAYWDSVADASRQALAIRYLLLPHLYTLFYHSHQTGSTVVRPLYHEYPTDVRAKTVDTQFLWGAALLISPVLAEDQTDLSAYLPNDTWYNYHTGRLETLVGDVVWATPLDKINVHVRGGHILPTQKEALNTMLSRRNNFGLIVALGSNGEAAGDLFWDDGETVDTIENDQYQYQTFTYQANVLKMDFVTKFAAPLGALKMDSLKMLGVKSKPSSINSAGTVLNESQIDYLDADHVLTLTNLGLSMVDGWQIEFTF